MPYEYKYRARAGHTLSQCPGCGLQGNDPNKGNYSYGHERPVDGVCRECRDLLDEAIGAREANTRQSEVKLYFVEKRGFYEGRTSGGGFYRHGGGESPEKSSSKYVIEEEMFNLAAVSATPLPIYGVKTEEYLMSHLDRNRMGAPTGVRMWLNPEFAESYRLLDWSIREELTRAYQAGFDKGSNLLSRLAEGSVSTAQFDAELTKK